MASALERVGGATSSVPFSMRHPFAVAIAGLLAAASLVCAGLVAARMLYSGSVHYWFLMWNLVLAWVPFLFAGLAYLAARGGRAIMPVVSVLAALVWLIFFPNAPYILTDFLHLGSMGDSVPGWYDVLMLFWFAWTGLMLGVVSLYLMQEIVRQAAGGALSWAFVIIAAGLGSFGIYLGRFLRWNSWDLLRRPRPLAAELYGAVTDPAAQPQLVGFTALFALLFLFVYGAVYIFAKLVRPLVAPAAGCGDQGGHNLGRSGEDGYSGGVRSGRAVGGGGTPAATDACPGELRQALGSGGQAADGARV